MLLLLLLLLQLPQLFMYIYIYRSSEPILIVYIVYVVIKKLINDGSLIHSLGTTYPNVDLVELPE